MRQPECNFLAALPGDLFDSVCDIITDMIIATDMAKHNGIVAQLEEMLEKYKPNDSQHLLMLPATAEDSRLILQVALKCADLGHLTMPWDLHLQWVQRLEKEFFAQGDMEKQMGLSISFLMDRGKPGVSESQQGFFDFVVLPLFTKFARAAPATEPLLKGVLDNFHRWQKTPDDKEEKPPTWTAFSKISTGSSFLDVHSLSCASSPRGDRSRVSSPGGESCPPFSLTDDFDNNLRNEEVAWLAGEEDS